MLKQHPRGFLYFANVPTCAPPSDSDSPERAAFLELLRHDPAEAKRERLKARVEYWRRLQALRERAELLRALIGQPALEDGVPALDRWRARIELTVAEGDLLEAAWRLHQLEQALGERSEPLPAAPAPAPLPPAEPRKPGRRVTCQCGECPKCKAREAMRRRRAAAKAAKGAKGARKARGVKKA
jgi:hypothetical protein